MKEAIRFILVYSVASLLILILLQIAFHPLNAEIFSYAIWLYIFCTVVSTVVFLLFGFLSTRYKLLLNTRVVCYAILCLFTLNSIPLFGEKKFLTMEAIKGLLSQKIDPIDVGVHVIAISSFIISSLIVLRRNTVTTS